MGVNTANARDGTMWVRHMHTSYRPCNQCPAQHCRLGLHCVVIVKVPVAVVPGDLVGGQDQFREFKSHRVHARRDFFLHKN